MKSLILIVSVMLLSTAAMAEPVQVEVSVLAHGAKFIGDRSGGATIIISNAQTGEVLAEGITRGSTGSTDLIMREKHPTWQKPGMEGAASFVAEIDIDEPLQIAISASGPVQSTGAHAKASTVSWLLPGEERKADRRIVLELTGYIVEVIESSITEDGKGDIVVDINMLCGCPVIPGGLWDANLIDRIAILRGSDSSETAVLEYTGEGTLYRASFSGKVERPNDVEFRVFGMKDSNATVRHFPLK